MKPTDERKFICRISPMSKTPLSLILILLSLLSVWSVPASDGNLKVGLNPDWKSSTVEVRLSGFSDRLPQIISFPSRVASVSFSPGRVVSVEEGDGDGAWKAARRISPFVFGLSEGLKELRIVIDVSAQSDPFSRPFVSWIERDRAVLIVSDLVPLELSGAVTVDAVGLGGEKKFRSIDSAVVAFPGEARGWTVTDGIRIARFGEWPIAQDVMFGVAREILEDYRKRFGPRLGSEVDIVLVRVEEGHGSWTARTIGSTVVIFSSGMPFSSQEIQRFHEQLRHELFHLWIPNSLLLVGDYATFYEGFALYQSLKSGVAIGRIRFADYLSTLSSAITIAKRADARRSTVGQWSDDRESLYAGGLVSAFITDVSLLSASGGRQSSDTFLREFLKTNDGLTIDAGASIRRQFALHDSLRMTGIGPDLMPLRTSVDSILPIAGLESRNGVLSVVAKPTGAQRKVLDRLGYNPRTSRIQVPIR